MRQDVAACTARWDAKTERTARRRSETRYAVDGMATLLDGETAIAVEPAAACDEDRVARVWGAVALTENAFVFNAASGHLRVRLADVDSVRILQRRRRLLPVARGGCTLAIGSGAALDYFELQSNGAVGRLWPELEAKVRLARSAA